MKTRYALLAATTALFTYACSLLLPVSPTTVAATPTYAATTRYSIPQEGGDTIDTRSLDGALVNAGKLEENCRFRPSKYDLYAYARQQGPNTPIETVVQFQDDSGVTYELYIPIGSDVGIILDVNGNKVCEVPIHR
ncbi:MAG: hypothetical protein J4428_03835 [Candidatus Aenigmarchaeota archaeon]|nr:hypothetical protein [Candidatus Aenigmarchaeota archaeon]